MDILPLLPSQTGAFDQKHLTKAADKIVAGMVEAGDNILDLLAQAARLEFVAARIKERAKAATLEEVRTYGKQGVSRYGVNMVVTPSGTKYDYSLDRVWTNLNEVVVKATAARAQHEKFLKALPLGGLMYTCDDTGEMYRAHAPAKTEGETVKIEIK